MPILHAFQNVEGWVSPEAIAQTAAWIGEPVSVVESTASFYTLFHRRPVGRYMLQPCRNLSCIINGAGEIMAHFRERLGIGHLETTPDGLFSYEEAECLAACDRAPCMQVNLEFVYDLTTEKVDAMLQAMRDGTYDVRRCRRPRAPGRTWHVSQDERQSGRARATFPAPTIPAASATARGVAMIERLARDPSPVEARPTKERLVADGVAAARIADGRDALPSEAMRRERPLMPVIKVLTEGIGEVEPARYRRVSRARRLRAVAPRGDRTRPPKRSRR